MKFTEDKIYSTEQELFDLIKRNSYVDPALYKEHKIKHGLRNEDGTGVLVGITRVAGVYGYEVEDGKKIAIPGKMYYRGIDVNEIIAGAAKEKRFGFEETMYLLIFGKLPNSFELKMFNALMDSLREFPKNFTEDVFFKIPSNDIMNKMQRVVLTLYSYDPEPDSIETENVARQSLVLLSKMPMIAAYAYRAKQHYFKGQSLIIHKPKENSGTAENLLHMIRPTSEYTEEEAQLLDLCLILHAEHGGGNNSAFATHVVSSSGTDTYSAISTAIGSLKGPKHGGANLKVADMVDDIKANCTEWTKADRLEEYLRKILAKEAYDRTGLIYGMGHAVYTVSDPRAMMIKEKAKALASKKDRMDDFDLLANIEEITIRLYKEKRGPDAQICANVDMYTGLVYDMLEIPRDLYTPIFAVSRTAGWLAHRLEQIRDPKIIRPGYVTLSEELVYTPLSER